MPEHLEILGPTGSGKSYFEKTILEARAKIRQSHVVIVATKPADDTLKSLGWPIIEDWPPDDHRHKQHIYWAKAKGLTKESREIQKEQVEHLMSELWRPKANIIVAFDEIAYIEQELQLRTSIQTYYREARGMGITLVASTQRPQGVSRYVHSESSWSVFFAPKDAEDAKRMAQVAGNEKYYRDVLMTLDGNEREFLIVHNRTKKAFISHIPDGWGV